MNITYDYFKFISFWFQTVFTACSLIFASLPQYTDGEEVTLWVNKVGPFPNPQETYAYYRYAPLQVYSCVNLTRSNVACHFADLMN